MTAAGSTRRRFFRDAGGALAAPLAAAGAAASAGAEDAPSLAARLAALEDLDAVRALTATFVQRLNAGRREELASLFADPMKATFDPAVRRLVAERAGELDCVVVAPDRATAVTRLSCAVHAETPIASDDTLVKMARAQGEGVVRRTERAVLETSCVREDGFWKIARVALRAG
jgi:hypothetical protein